MPVRVGNTEIASLGKIKLGTTNITKVFCGSVQIWPSSFLFEGGNAQSGSASLTCSSTTSFQSGLYCSTSSLVVGSVIYTDSNLTTVWQGLNSFWVIRLQGTSQQIAYRVNNSGVVQEVVPC
jgi:hypothetical protein